jgi:hypothetical protein
MDDPTVCHPLCSHDVQPTVLSPNAEALTEESRASNGKGDHGNPASGTQGAGHRLSYRQGLRRQADLHSL